MMISSSTDCTRHPGVNGAAVVKSQPAGFALRSATFDHWESKAQDNRWWMQDCTRHPGIQVSMALQWLSLSQQASLLHLKNSLLLCGGIYSTLSVVCIVWTVWKLCTVNCVICVLWGTTLYNVYCCQLLWTAVEDKYTLCSALCTAVEDYELCTVYFTSVWTVKFAVFLL